MDFKNLNNILGQFKANIEDKMKVDIFGGKIIITIEGGTKCTDVKIDSEFFNDSIKFTADNNDSEQANLKEDSESIDIKQAASQTDSTGELQNVRVTDESKEIMEDIIKIAIDKVLEKVSGGGQEMLSNMFKMLGLPPMFKN